MASTINDERLFHLASINEKTGQKSYLSVYPMTHDRACNMLKANTVRSGRRIQLEEWQRANTIHNVCYAHDGSDYFRVLPVSNGEVLATLIPIDSIGGSEIGERIKVPISDLFDHFLYNCDERMIFDPSERGESDE